MNPILTLVVEGEPVPKQSYRAAKKGGYTDPRVKSWQEKIAWQAKLAMQGNPPTDQEVSMRVIFILGNHRRIDLDNLNKAVADALNGIVYLDDSQITSLHLVKHIKQTPGVFVQVYPGACLPLLDKGAENVRQ